MTEFAKRLQELFPHLRIRWSAKRKAYHIEQQVGRASLPTFKVDPFDDAVIRAKDGYWFVMEIQPGDRMPCPECSNTLKVPHLEFKEITCEVCKRDMYRDGHVMAAYFPLGESLIDYLRMGDYRTGRQVELADKAESYNRNLLQTKERDRQNTGEALFKEDFTDIAEIESVGFTGKEHAWDVPRRDN